MNPGNAGNEVSHIAVGRLGHYLLGGADLNDCTVFHNSNSVTDPNGFLEVMRDEDRGLPE